MTVAMKCTRCHGEGQCMAIDGKPLRCGLRVGEKRLRWFVKLDAVSLSRLGGAALRLLFAEKAGRFGPATCPDCKGDGRPWFSIRRADA